jgi:hypothetical protein
MFGVIIVVFSLVISILQNEPSLSYTHIGPFLGSVIDTLKMSLGDFEVISRVHNT